MSRLVKNVDHYLDLIEESIGLKMFFDGLRIDKRRAATENAKSDIQDMFDNNVHIEYEFTDNSIKFKTRIQNGKSSKRQ